MTKDIQIITKNSKVLHIDTYVLQVEGYKDHILYKEHIDQDYTIADAYIQTQDGQIIDDAILLEKIQGCGLDTHPLSGHR
jgi:hypothetical protein